MSSASMKPQHVAPALTVTISSATSISFNPSSAQVASGGVVEFASANSTAWEVELFNKDNNEAHAMRLYVPASGSSEMIAAPMNSPREVHFNIMAYSGAKPNKTGTSGTYKITITSGPVGGE